jgi:hypothetical protein
MNEQDLRKYAQFTDWLDMGEFEDKNWIVVARTLKINKGPFDEDFFTFSVLAAARTEEDYASILSTTDWRVTSDFGRPSVWDDVDGNIKFDPGYNKRIDGILYRPFILRRDFGPIHPPIFEIVQDFVLFYNLYFQSEESVYRKLNSTGIEVDVIKLSKDSETETILVRTNYLRDYLYFNKMALIRQHDHKRWFREASPVATGEGNPLYIRETGKIHYSLSIVNDTFFKESKCLSFLHGMDIVRPFSKPDNSLHSFSFDKQFEKFIIRLNSDGEPIERMCNESHIGSHNGQAPFLTPVFFKKELLKYYYDNPKTFSVDENCIRCLDQWYITYGINSEGLIQVWLGDLGRLPYEVQKYWRLLNVPPEGGIPKEVFQRDLEAEFVESTDPVSKFKRVLELSNSNFKTQFGFRLHKTLPSNDLHCYQTIHIPVTNEQKEFDEQILYLAKILIDSMNKSEMDKRISKSSQSGSIESLGFFLSEITECQDTDISIIIDTFSMIQTIRSTGAAHSKGSKFEGKMIKYGLTELPNNMKRFEEILNRAREALIILSSINPK